MASFFGHCRTIFRAKIAQPPRKYWPVRLFPCHTFKKLVEETFLRHILIQVYARSCVKVCETELVQEQKTYGSSSLATNCRPGARQQFVGVNQSYSRRRLSVPPRLHFVARDILSPMWSRLYRHATFLCKSTCTSFWSVFQGLNFLQSVASPD